MRNVQWIGLVIAGLLAAMPMAAQAMEPVALVLELDGATNPEIEAFSELSAGDTVGLSDGATMLFLHYPRCEEVTVRGGRLVLSQERYTLQGGTVVKVDRARCPKTVVLTENREVGGVLIRGSSKVELAPRPEFVVVGAQVASIAKVRVRDGETVIVETTLNGHAFAWPAGAPDLQASADSAYVAELLDASGQVLKSLEFSIKARGRAPVTVVRF